MKMWRLPHIIREPYLPTFMSLAYTHAYNHGSDHSHVVITHSSRNSGVRLETQQPITTLLVDKSYSVRTVYIQIFEALNFCVFADSSNPRKSCSRNFRTQHILILENCFRKMFGNSYGLKMWAAKIWTYVVAFCRWLICGIYLHLRGVGTKRSAPQYYIQEKYCTCGHSTYIAFWV